MSHLPPLVASRGSVLVAWVAAWSLVAWAAMWLDKRQASRGGPRLRERTLVLLALLGGGPGALLAACAARHKTRKPLVLLPLWAAALGWVALLLWATLWHVL